MASASSTPQPPAQPQTQVQSSNTNPFIHNVALGVTPIALFALFLPPRRLDMRAVILGGVVLWGTNQLVLDYSGTSSLRRIGQRLQSMSPDHLPEKARETQARIRAERAERARRLAAQEAAGLSEEQRRMLAEQRRKKAEEEEEKGILERLWMGDSGADWKEKRDRREKEALSEGGGGYWGLIVDQISEVWSGGKKKDSEEKERGNTENESKKS
ncbi:hypothetical protein GGS26DRAFT_11104 [Hypomontagnella submonticulosa]|nr:hypothetical protein GGS26DRAFT_11104 [Hypomontagnella submonticulosa]